MARSQLRRRLRLRERGRWIHSAFDRRYRLSTRRVAELRGAHRGERCVVIGNGPSLLRTDLSLIGSATTFTLNRGYLLFDRLGRPSDHHVCVNRLVLEQFGVEISRVPGTRWSTWPNRDLVLFDETTVLLHKIQREHFSVDLSCGIWEGATVTFVALQIAYFLGFAEVVLLGIDHAFQSAGTPHETVTSRGDDPDHFSPDYFGEGTRWQLPDLATSERAYGLAERAFRRAGREVIDATVGGRLEVFRKVPFESL